MPPIWSHGSFEHINLTPLKNDYILIPFDWGVPTFALSVFDRVFLFDAENKKGLPSGSP